MYRGDLYHVLYFLCNSGDLQRITIILTAVNPVVLLVAQYLLYGSTFLGSFGSLWRARRRGNKSHAYMMTMTRWCNLSIAFKTYYGRSITLTYESPVIGIHQYEVRLRFSKMTSLHHNIPGLPMPNSLCMIRQGSSSFSLRAPLAPCDTCSGKVLGIDSLSRDTLSFSKLTASSARAWFDDMGGQRQPQQQRLCSGIDQMGDDLWN